MRDENGLASALGRPFQTFGGNDLYPTPFEKAAALLDSICNNHPFVDGNKRTALLGAAYLLYVEGTEIEVPLDDGELFVLEVAQGVHDVAVISEHLRRWTV